jgi:predicted amidophosphoribosyltransferase
MLPPSPRSILRDGLAILLPVACAGCGDPDGPICDACSRAIVPAPAQTVRGSLRITCSLDYEGRARGVIAAFKDAGRTDAAGALAPATAAAIDAVLHECAAGAPIELVSVPSSRASERRRGYRHVDLLLRRAGLRSASVLRAVAPRADQVGLSRSGRLANVRATLAARTRLDGRRFIVVDDIVTTGATMAEAARAIESAGGVIAGLAAIAQTPLRNNR